MNLSYNQVRKKIEGVCLARETPKINHLLFADDCLLFVKAKLSQLKSLKALIAYYESVAGQRINVDKCEFTASPNIDEFMITIFKEFLGMKHVSTHSKYLGLPLTAGQNKREVFRDIEERMEKKVHDWKNLTLSWGGREILIKACLQALPLFTMSCFKLPRSLCERFASTAFQFWWKGNSEGKGIHWIKKEILLKEKSQGGLGFRSFTGFNDAMLMRQFWRLLMYSELLVSKVLREKYFKNGELLSCKPKPSDSMVWRSIASTLDMFKNGLVRDPDSNWKWIISSSGTYSVRSGYALANRWNGWQAFEAGETSNRDLRAKLWRRFWRISIPERIKIVMWRLYYDALPTFENLRRRGCAMKEGCVFCGFKHENSLHLFLKCWWAKSFWKNLLGVEWPEEECNSIRQWIWFIVSEKNLSDKKNHPRNMGVVEEP